MCKCTNILNTYCDCICVFLTPKIFYSILLTSPYCVCRCRFTLHFSCRYMTKGLWSIFWGRKDIIFRKTHKSIMYRWVKSLMTCILCSCVLLSEGINQFIKLLYRIIQMKYQASTSYIPRIGCEFIQNMMTTEIV